MFAVIVSYVFQNLLQMIRLFRDLLHFSPHGFDRVDEQGLLVVGDVGDVVDCRGLLLGHLHHVEDRVHPGCRGVSDLLDGHDDAVHL